MGVTVFCLSLVVLDLSLVAAPPLSGLPWADESVVTAWVVVFTIETVVLIAWVTCVELVVCATGGNTTVQPAIAGLEAH